MHNNRQPRCPTLSPPSWRFSIPSTNPQPGTSSLCSYRLHLSSYMRIFRLTCTPRALVGPFPTCFSLPVHHPRPTCISRPTCVQLRRSGICSFRALGQDIPRRLSPRKLLSRRWTDHHSPAVRKLLRRWNGGGEGGLGGDLGVTCGGGMNGAGASGEWVRVDGM